MNCNSSHGEQTRKIVTRSIQSYAPPYPRRRGSLVLEKREQRKDTREKKRGFAAQSDKKLADNIRPYEKPVGFSNNPP